MDAIFAFLLRTPSNGEMTLGIIVGNYSFDDDK